jgi:hypothetical protein
MADIDPRQLDRQRQIWTNLYGPRQAGELLEAASELGARRPELPAKDLFASVDPERDEDYVDFVATRW